MGIPATKAPPVVLVPNSHERLVDKFLEIARENAELRKENASLIKAVENLDTANVRIGNELTEVRWQLIQAQEIIRRYEELDVEVSVQ